MFPETMSGTLGHWQSSWQPSEGPRMLLTSSLKPQVPHSARRINRVNRALTTICVDLIPWLTSTLKRRMLTPNYLVRTLLPYIFGFCINPWYPNKIFPWYRPFPPPSFRAWNSSLLKGQPSNSFSTSSSPAHRAKLSLRWLWMVSRCICQNNKKVPKSGI